MDPVDPPSGEFPPVPVVARSWRRPAALITVVGATLVAVGVFARVDDPGLVPGPSTAIAAASPETIVGPSRSLPPTVVCHELDRATCLDVVAAALRGLPADAPQASAASAWRSLLCDSSIDCPPLDLQLAVPRGSVVVDFVDGGPAAWLNVVDRATPSGASMADAWIVRWQRAPVPTPLVASPPASDDRASPGPSSLRPTSAAAPGGLDPEATRAGAPA